MRPFIGGSRIGGASAPIYGRTGPGTGFAGLGLAGLATWIMSQKNKTNMSLPNIETPSILSDVFTTDLSGNHTRKTIFPHNGSKAPSILSHPAIDYKKQEIINRGSIPQTPKALILSNPFTYPRLQDNFTSFSLEDALNRGTSGYKRKGRSGPGAIRRTGHKQHEKRVHRDLGVGVPVDFPYTPEVSIMLDKFMEDPNNVEYIDRVAKGKIPYVMGSREAAGLFGVWGHPPGETIEEYSARTGTNAPDHIVGGELNNLERKSRDAGNTFKTYREVMDWARHNIPEFKGFSMQDMINRLGVPTKYF